MASQEIEEDLLELKKDGDSSKSKESEEEIISRMRKTMETHMVVAALIATVTFTAGFTPPGGYVQSGSSSEGMAVLSLPSKGNTTTQNQDDYVAERDLFQYFIVANGIGLVLSVCAIGVYFYASLPKREKHIMEFSLFYGTMLTVAAMAAMVIAFVLGTQAVTESNLAISVVFLTFLGMQIVPWFLKAPSPLLCIRGPRASSWGRKQTANFILFSVLFGFYLFEVFATGWSWDIALGFPMLLFTILLYDYL